MSHEIPALSSDEGKSGHDRTWGSVCSSGKGTTSFLKEFMSSKACWVAEELMVNVGSQESKAGTVTAGNWGTGAASTEKDRRRGGARSEWSRYAASVMDG